MASLLTLRRGKNGILPADRRRARRGLSTVELLVAITTVSVVMVGVANLLNASWQAYRNLVWQNKANMEARRALDDICDTIRMGGNDSSLNLFQSSLAAKPQVEADIADTSAEVGTELNDKSGSVFYYAVLTASSGANYLVREKNDEFVSEVAQYVDSVQFEYEYRLPAGTNRATWQMQRVANLVSLYSGSDPRQNPYLYLPKTVYVTVNVRIPTNVTGASQDYTRTLTSAVTLRGPYDNAAPPAQAIVP